MGEGYFNAAYSQELMFWTILISNMKRLLDYPILRIIFMILFVLDISFNQFKGKLVSNFGNDPIWSTLLKSIF